MNTLALKSSSTKKRNDDDDSSNDNDNDKNNKDDDHEIMTMMFSNTYSRPVMREQIPLLRDSVERSGSRLWYFVGC